MSKIYQRDGTVKASKHIRLLALIADVLIQLVQNSLIDVLTWIIAIVPLEILLRYNINSMWLIVSGAMVGVVRFIIVG